jgi:hypothetical protein
MIASSNRRRNERPDAGSIGMLRDEHKRAWTVTVISSERPLIIRRFRRQLFDHLLRIAIAALHDRVVIGSDDDEESSVACIAVTDARR